MKNLKRSILWTILLALVLASGSGCTPAGEAPTPTEEAGVSSPTPLATAEPPPTGAGSPTTTEEPADDFSGVTIRFAAHEQHRVEMEALALEFHELNPSIRVEFVSLDDFPIDFAGDVVAQYYQLVSAADTLWTLPLSDAVSQGMLRDLTPFIEADASFEPDDFFPGMLEAFRWGGGTWALPSQANLILVFYNRQLFDAGGVPYPSPEWTRDDFLVAAQALTLREGDEVVQYGYLNSGGGWGAFVYSAVAGLAEEVALDAPVVIDAVRWYTDLAFVHGVMLPSCRVDISPEHSTNAVCRDKVRAGKAAMWSESFSFDPDGFLCDSREIAAGCDGEVGVAPFPTEGGPVAPAHMNGYFMSAGTVHPQESWRWLRFLTYQRVLHQPQDFIPAYMGHWLPARRSVAEESGFFDQFDEETRRVMEVAAEHVYFSRSTEATRQMGSALRAVQDGVAVEEALAEAQASLEQALAEEVEVTPVTIVVATPQPVSGAVIDFAPPPGVDPSDLRTLAAAFSGEREGEVQVQIVAPNRAESADCFASWFDLEFDSEREGRLNVQSMVDGDAGFPLDDFHPRFLEAARYQGDLWGVPTSAQVRVVFYNRDLFDAAGEPYPEVGWTLDEFLARALALTGGSGDEQVYGFVPLDGHAVGLRTFLALQGVDLWDPEDEGRPRFDAPDVVAAVRWYADLALAHGVMPLPVEGEDVTEWGAGSQERRALIEEGRAAMWTGVAGLQVDQGVALAGIEVGMAPPPLREAGAQGVTSFSYEGLFIADDAAEMEACWEWIKHLSAQPQAIPGLPARASLLESTWLVSRLGEDGAATYRATLAYADLWDTHPTTQEAAEQEEHLVQALADILAGADPEAALAEAQENAVD